jgi:acyl-CoA dehydrogenase
MHFELLEEHRMLAELVQRFVREEIMPLEQGVLERAAAGQGSEILDEDRKRLDGISRDLGLWGLDAPEDVGGMDLPHVALVAVNEALGSSVARYDLPPDSPNLRMLMVAASPEQKKAYLEPYIRAETLSAIAISEPGAGADPAGMRTRAVRDGDDWVINGRKIWISNAVKADFTILMALTDPEKRARGGMSAFLIDKDTPGYHILRRIPMLGGSFTYEIACEDLRVPASKLLGVEGQGFGPMQVRLSTRRMEVAAWCIAAAERALGMMCEWASERTTFGQKLSDRQTVQWWAVDAASMIRATRLMAYECAWKLDQGHDVRNEISTLKFFATEMAQKVIDNAMQCLGAMGMTKELPLYLLAEKVRVMRILDGPSEVHRMVVARSLLKTRG